jgi:DNA-binding beta-propeller fold protein YncE
VRMASTAMSGCSPHPVLYLGGEYGAGYSWYSKILVLDTRRHTLRTFSHVGGWGVLALDQADGLVAGQASPGIPPSPVGESMSLLDPRSGTSLKTIAITGMPIGALFNNATGNIVVTSNLTAVAGREANAIGAVSIYTPGGTAVMTATLGSMPGLPVEDETNGHVFVPTTGGEIRVYEAATGALLAAVRLGVLGMPRIALDQTNHLLVVANPESKSASVLDTVTDRLVTEFGAHPASPERSPTAAMGATLTVAAVTSRWL